MAQTSSTITESLMGISRMMSQQVQQSEEAMQTLGKERSCSRAHTQTVPQDMARQFGPLGGGGQDGG